MNLMQRVEKLSSFDAQTGCREWAGARDSEGYARLSLNNRNWKASRAVWIEAHGDIPAGMCVLHRCDNPACVNVDHLFLGTHAENMADKVAKGRSARAAAKLTPAQVLEIRKQPTAKAADLARIYGVVNSVIHAIRYRKTWRYL